MSSNELPKVIDKSQADIDAAINAIKASAIPAATKDFAISCIKLAVWLPKALLEHKIKLSNLRKLIFGLGWRNKKKPSNEAGQSDAKNETKDSDGLNSIEEPAPVSTETETAEVANPLSAPGHGRLPHSAYTNTIEHQLSIPDLETGDLCPTQCGGKLYHIEPGILVRVKGQNLAAVLKFWIEKLRCALCGYLVSADVPDEVGNQKYDVTFKVIIGTAEILRCNSILSPSILSIIVRCAIACFYPMATRRRSRWCCTTCFSNIRTNGGEW